MLRLLVVAALAVAVSATATTRRARNPNALVLGATLEADRVMKIATKIMEGDENECIHLRSAKNGFRFKTTETTTGLSFEPCSDGRSCAKLIECETEHPGICLEAVDCFDPTDKKRCMKMEKCQCLKGDFRTVDADAGFTIVDENTGDLTEEDIEDGAVLIEPLFKREECYLGGFNMRACEPGESGCENFLPCEPDDLPQCVRFEPNV